ncbi:unnamed protein product [Calypogeia fissa]
MEDRPPCLPPISDQRTLFLVSTFVIHTVRLLNNFSVICEDKLADVHRRIVQADATVSLLEAKLRSVDGLEGTVEHTAQPPELDIGLPPGTPESSEPHHSTRSSMTEAELSRASSVLPALDEPELLKARDDPKYTRFFRMLQVGVPLPAVKIQMSLEGLDGSVLDVPDQPNEND